MSQPASTPDMTPARPSAEGAAAAAADGNPPQAAAAAAAPPPAPAPAPAPTATNAPGPGSGSGMAPPGAGGAPTAPPAAGSTAGGAARGPLISGGARDVLLGLLIAAVLALAFFAWRGQVERTAVRMELAQRLAAADELNRLNQQVALEAQRNVRDMAVTLSALEAQLAESQNQQIALEALYQDLARGRDEAALAEIEQSLIAANQQLLLAGNVRVALIALQSVEARLALIDRAQLAPLRRALAADIERLQGVPQVDTVGIATRLDRALAGIDLLPVQPGATRSGTTPVAVPAAAEPSPAPTATDAASAASATTAGAAAGAAAGESPAGAAAPAAGWRAALARLWSEFKAEFRQLASIRRLDQDALPLITPQQAWFLRENLRLRLLSARLALLARDQSGFRTDVSMARGWIARYFDTRDPAAAALIEMLRELERAEVRIELPDIAASIEAVRVLRVSRDRRP